MSPIYDKGPSFDRLVISAANDTGDGGDMVGSPHLHKSRLCVVPYTCRSGRDGALVGEDGFTLASSTVVAQIT